MQIDKRGIIIIGIAFLLFVAGTHYYINKMEMEGADTRVVWPNQNEQKNAPLENSVTEGMSLEEVAKVGILHQLGNSSNISIDRVSVEASTDNYAYGEFDHQNRELTYKNDVWFAVKENGLWNVIYVSFVGYFGNCSVFEKVSFPKNMIPDCWDQENKVVLETTNPAAFYKNGLTKNEKGLIAKAFLSYIKAADPERVETYSSAPLYVRINKSVPNKVSGTILVEGRENISAPIFYAVKESGNWRVLYNGQDTPLCKDVESYNFPSVILKECVDMISSKPQIRPLITTGD